MSKIGLLGASGAIGKLLAKTLCSKDNIQNTLSVIHIRGELNLELSNILKNNPHTTTIVTNDINELINNCDVVIDFSTKEATLNLLQAIDTKDTNIPALVICTTALTNEHFELIEKNSKKTAILQASNTSLGVSVLNALIKQASKILSDYDCEIVEYHHNKKIDAPSGTALSLANTCAKSRGLGLDKVRVSSRDGVIGARSKDEIGVMAIRGGDIAGKHIVGFYGDGEYVELTHNASSKQTFVNGAIKCAKFLSDKKNGLYSIDDVVKVNI